MRLRWAKGISTFFLSFAETPYSSLAVMSRTICLARAFVDRARYLPLRLLRAASRFERTDLAVALARAIANQAVIVGERSMVAVGLLARLRFFPGRTDADVSAMVVGEVGALERYAGFRCTSWHSRRPDRMPMM